MRVGADPSLRASAGRGVAAEGMRNDVNPTHRRAAIAAVLLAALAPARALAQTCTTCWTEACPQLASYTPPCEKAPPPTGPARLTINSSPQRIEAFVDGRPVGSTPVSGVALPPGTYTVRVQSRCAAADERVLVSAGEVRSVSLRPRSTTASVLVTAKGGGRLDADVAIDGVPFDLTSKAGDVPVCSRTLSVRARDGRRWSTPLSLRPGETKVIETGFSSVGPPVKRPPATTPAPAPVRPPPTTNTPPPANPPPPTPPTGPIDPTVLANMMADCQNGAGPRCREVGTLFEEGRGVVADKTKAAGFFEKGCDLSDGPSCTALGRLYANGDGVPQDPDRANAIYERACNLGERAACAQVRRTGYAPGAGLPSVPSNFHSHWMLGGGSNTGFIAEPWQAFVAWVNDEPNSAFTFFASAGYEHVSVRHPDFGVGSAMHQVNVSPLNVYMGSGIWRFGAGLDFLYGFGQEDTSLVNGQGFAVGGSVGGGLSTDLGPIHVLALVRYKGAKGPREEGLFLDVALGIKGL